MEAFAGRARIDGAVQQRVGKVFDEYDAAPRRHGSERQRHPTRDRVQHPQEIGTDGRPVDERRSHDDNVGLPTHRTARVAAPRAVSNGRKHPADRVRSLPTMAHHRRPADRLDAAREHDAAYAVIACRLRETQGTSDVSGVERGIGVGRLVAHHVHAGGEMDHAIGGQTFRPAFVRVEIGGGVHPLVHAVDAATGAPYQCGHRMPGCQRAAADCPADETIRAGDDEMSHRHLRPCGLTARRSGVQPRMAHAGNACQCARLSAHDRHGELQGDENEHVRISKTGRRPIAGAVIDRRRPAGIRGHIVPARPL